MNNFLFPQAKFKGLFKNKFLVIIMTGLIFFLLDKIIRLYIAEMLVKYSCLSVLYLITVILLYIVNNTSHKNEEFSSSNHSFLESIAEVKFVFDNAYNLLHKNRADLSVLVIRLREYRNKLLEKEKIISLQKVLPSHPSPYKIAWGTWRTILIFGVFSFILLTRSLFKVYLASYLLGWIYFTFIILFLSIPWIKKYRSIGSIPILPIDKK